MILFGLCATAIGPGMLRLFSVLLQRATMMNQTSSLTLMLSSSTAFVARGTLPSLEPPMRVGGVLRVEG
jgi:hypothetical protein